MTDKEADVKFTVMTLFPEMVLGGLHTSIIGRAQDSGIIEINAVDIRDYSTDKHRHVDDYPYGGGAGMVMSAEPIYACYEDITGISKRCSEGNSDECQMTEALAGLDKNTAEGSGTALLKRPRLVYLTPQGKTFDQTMAKELAKEDELIFLCGHYEGVDERVLEEIVTDNVSIGDYVLSGGELAAMVMIDAISRMVPGVLTNEESGLSESFENSLLEYPQYTRPENWRGKKVPEVLLSGHHANIERWRREKSLERTRKFRPDLLEKAELDANDSQFLNKLNQRQD